MPQSGNSCAAGTIHYAVNPIAKQPFIPVPTQEDPFIVSGNVTLHPIRANSVC